MVKCPTRALVKPISGAETGGARAENYNAIIAGRGDREAVIDVLIRNTPLKDRALYDRMYWVYMDPNLTLDENDLRTTMQWFVDRGLVERPTDLSVAVDRRFSDNALRVLGLYR